MSSSGPTASLAESSAVVALKSFSSREFLELRGVSRFGGSVFIATSASRGNSIAACVCGPYNAHTRMYNDAQRDRTVIVMTIERDSRVAGALGDVMYLRHVCHIRRWPANDPGAILFPLSPQRA